MTCLSLNTALICCTFRPMGKKISLLTLDSSMLNGGSWSVELPRESMLLIPKTKVSLLRRCAQTPVAGFTAVTTQSIGWFSLALSAESICEPKYKLVAHRISSRPKRSSLRFASCEDCHTSTSSRFMVHISKKTTSACCSPALRQIATSTTSSQMSLYLLKGSPKSSVVRS